MRKDAGRTYRVCVDVPERVVDEYDMGELFMAIADAAFEWESRAKAERDGWDIDVHAGFADETSNRLTREESE